MGASGAISESEQVLDTQKYRSKLRQLTIDVGLRHLLTDRGALVDVSVLALAEGGYADNTITTEGSPSSDQSLTSWIAGGDVELALDRELTAGLSLRVATPLAGVWWQKTDEKLSGLSGQGHSITASFYLAPRLELRLAF